MDGKSSLAMEVTQYSHADSLGSLDSNMVQAVGTIYEGDMGDSRNLPFKFKRPSGATRRRKKKLKMTVQQRADIASTSRLPAPINLAAGKQQDRLIELEKPTENKDEMEGGDDPPDPSKSNRGDPETFLPNDSKRIQTVATTVSNKNVSNYDTDSQTVVMVATEDYPTTQLSEEKKDIIVGFICEKIALGSGEVIPRFGGYTLSMGALKIICLDIHTKGWLESVICGCVLWESAKLRIIDPKHLEPVTIATVLPSPKKDMENIAKQSPVIETTSSNIVSESPVQNIESLEELSRSATTSLETAEKSSVYLAVSQDIDTSTESLDKNFEQFLLRQDGGPAEKHKPNRAAHRKPKKKRKKTKETAESVPQYKLETAKKLQVAVVRADGEAMTKDDAEHVSNHLVTVMDDIESRRTTADEDWWPKYEESEVIAVGMFLITCDDERTRFWTAQQTIPPREQIQYLVLEGEEIPRMIRVSVWVPGKKRPLERFLKRLAGQNTGLRTDLWRILGSFEKDEGSRMVIIIDPQSLRVLEEKKWRLHYELGRLTFKRMDEKEDRNQSAHSRMASDK